MSIGCVSGRGASEAGRGPGPDGRGGFDGMELPLALDNPLPIVYKL